MHPRPLHRWKSFWLGLIVLIFLGWAWVRSTGGWDEVHFTSPGSSNAVFGSNATEGLSFGWTDYPFVPEGVSFASFRGGQINNWFPEAVTLVGGRTLECVTIAHWFLILLFLVPWAGFLFWRIRRMRRAGKLPPPVEN